MMKPGDQRCRLAGPAQAIDGGLAGLRIRTSS
jgi:hypothetical protein